jgi:hypothetical protein
MDELPPTMAVACATLFYPPFPFLLHAFRLRICRKVEFGNKNSLLQIKHVFSPFFYHLSPVEKVAIQLELKNANQDGKRKTIGAVLCVSTLPPPHGRREYHFRIPLSIV